MPPPNMIPVEISIAMEYEHFVQKSERYLQHALAGFLEIPPDNVKVISTSEGSVRMVVTLPEVEAKRLICAYEMKDPTLSERLVPLCLIGIHRDMESRKRLQTHNQFSNQSS
ncbi:MAG: hypothetical protein GY774_40190 [Planctomycetes bacterium]|nr:hypothetical protein [Planctomycetota bacterium]